MGTAGRGHDEVVMVRTAAGRGHDEAVIVRTATNINAQLLRARGVLGIFHILISISRVI